MKEIILRIIEAKKKQQSKSSVVNSNMHSKSACLLLSTANLGGSRKSETNDIVSITRSVDLAIRKYLDSCINWIPSELDEASTREMLLNPLEYWKNYGNDHEIVAMAVRSVFSIPSSSCPMELDFGKATHMVTRYRNSLKSETIDMSQTICANIDLVDIPQIDIVSKANVETFLPTAPRTSPELFSDEQPDYVVGDEVYVIETIEFDTESE